MALVGLNEADLMVLCVQTIQQNGGVNGSFMAVACPDNIMHSRNDSKSMPGTDLADHPFPWYAIQVRTKHELNVANLLYRRGYDPFVPVYQARRRWSDRVKVSQAALFPGYLFCRLNIQNRLPILTTPGVSQIVGYSKTPTPVDESEINAIQALVASGLPNQPWPFLRSGDRVHIERGPLRGLEGILIEIRGAHRLVLSVTLLQRSVAVEIEPGFVRSVEKSQLSS
jgi:transcription antitermination factor NusG